MNHFNPEEPIMLNEPDKKTQVFIKVIMFCSFIIVVCEFYLLTKL